MRRLCDVKVFADCPYGEKHKAVYEVGKLRQKSLADFRYCRLQVLVCQQIFEACDLARQFDGIGFQAVFAFA